MVPPLGVVVGPLSSTGHALICFSVSSGTLWFTSSLCSMVSPEMGTRQICPSSSSFLSRQRSTRSASRMITGPMPSPGTRPMESGLA